MSSLRKLAAAAALAACLAAPAARAQTVNVNLGSTLGTVPPYGLGLGVAVWDGDLMDAAIPGLVQNAGYKIWRFPGGSYADLYNWQTNAAVPGQSAYIVAADNFDNFMSQARAAGGTALITVNYGSNFAGNGGANPSEAAGWVQYANKTKGYGIKYWEVGNEVYGNGFYGSQWEVDLHADKSPTAYGTNLKAISSAMKAVDSTIKVGAVVTTPGNWPDGLTPDWNNTVLSIACASIDFVVFHWYPSNNPLYAPQNEIPSIMSNLRSKLAANCGSRASSIEIWLTEGNWSGTTIDGALFGADQFLGWWEHGLASMDWWDLHNGINLVGGVNQDSGIFSNASCSGGVCEPAANTPYPIYYGTQMVNDVARPGDTLVTTSSSSSSVIAHAVKNGSRFGLMLINKDPNAAQTVTVTVSGGTPSATATKYFYGRGSTAVTSSALSGLGGTFTVSLPAYSITDVVGTLGTTTSYTLTIASAGNGTTSPAPGTYTYPAGSSVTVTATPSTGFTFAGWTGAATGTTNPLTLTVNANTTLTANFNGTGACTSVPPAPTGVTAAAASSSEIDLSWQPVSVNVGCAAPTYRVYRSTVAGQQGTAIATGVAGTTYASTGLAAATTYYFQVQADKGSGNVSALSTQVSARTGSGTTYALTVARAGTGSGTVTSSPAGVSCGTTCSASFGAGTTVTLSAAAASGSTFAGWSGGCTGTAATCTVTLAAATTVTATFNGSGTTPCANPVTFTGNTGSFNTTGAVCYRIGQAVNGWGCCNFDGRTVSVNGGAATATCGAGPFPLAKASDGYTYFSATAGTYPWACIYVW